MSRKDIQTISRRAFFFKLPAQVSYFLRYQRIRTGDCLTGPPGIFLRSIASAPQFPVGQGFPFVSGKSPRRREEKSVVASPSSPAFPILPPGSLCLRSPTPGPSRPVFGTHLFARSLADREFFRSRCRYLAFETLPSPSAFAIRISGFLTSFSHRSRSIRLADCGPTSAGAPVPAGSPLTFPCPPCQKGLLIL